MNLEFFSNEKIYPILITIIGSLIGSLIGVWASHFFQKHKDKHSAKLDLHKSIRTAHEEIISSYNDLSFILKLYYASLCASEYESKECTDKCLSEIELAIKESNKKMSKMYLYLPESYIKEADLFFNDFYKLYSHLKNINHQSEVETNDRMTIAALIKIFLDQNCSPSLQKLITKSRDHICNIDPITKCFIEDAKTKSILIADFDCCGNKPNQNHYRKASEIKKEITVRENLNI